MSRVKPTVRSSPFSSVKSPPRLVCNDCLTRRDGGTRHVTDRRHRLPLLPLQVRPHVEVHLPLRHAGEPETTAPLRIQRTTPPQRQ
jgi:hypothetical protein